MNAAGKIFACCGDKLFDGVRVIDDFCLMWQDGIVIYCGSRQGCEIPSGVKVIDVRDCFVMPGMFNCHVHILRSGAAFSAKGNSEAQDDSVVDCVINGIRNARTLLENGVVWVRDCGSPGDIIFELRDRLHNGQILGAELMVAGEALSITGGHGGKDTMVCNGPEGFVYGVRRQVEKGCDHIKIMATGSFSDRGQELCPPQMTRAELTAAVETAHRHGRRVAAHAHGITGVRWCIESGVDSIEHGTLMTEELIRLLGEKKGYLVSTLSAPYFVTYPGTPEQRSDPRYQETVNITRRHMATVPLAFESGVKLCVGSDCGASCVPFSECLTEMVLMSRSGLDNLEVLCAATRNSAELLGLSECYGTLEPGKTATFVVLSKNPLEDMENIRAPKDVYKDGELLYSGIAL